MGESDYRHPQVFMKGLQKICVQLVLRGDFRNVLLKGCWLRNQITYDLARTLLKVLQRAFYVEYKQVLRLDVVLKRRQKTGPGVGRI